MSLPATLPSPQAPLKSQAPLLRWLLLVSLLVMLVTRIAGPSAMHRFDQPKTVAYTASMVLHGEWLLPDDMFGRKSTKPPLVNWLAAPVVSLGVWTEWAAKLPMLLASLVTLLITVLMGRHLLSRCAETAAWATEGGLLAGFAWLVSRGTMDALYHCRPDPVLVTCLIGAWALATLAFEGEKPCSRWILPGLWICVGLAGLTKGPPALLLMLYVPLAARLIYPGASAAARTGWHWGIPLSLGIIGIWLVPVAVFHSEHFFNTLLGKELLSRVAGVGDQFGDVEKGGGTLALLTGIYRNPLWLIEKMLPWSLATLGALWLIKPRQWFRHALGSAILWMFLVLGFFSLTAGKTADYILPAYPAAAILSAYFCVRMFGRWRFTPAVFGWLGLLLTIGLCVKSARFSSAAREPYGDNLIEFAEAASLKVKNDPVAFVGTGYNTLQFFMGRHQPSTTASEQLKTAQWIIQPVNQALKAELVSEKLPGVSGKAVPLGLYRADEVAKAEAAKLLH